MYWGVDDDLKVIHVDIDPTELTRVMAPTIGTLGMRPGHPGRRGAGA